MFGHERLTAEELRALRRLLGMSNADRTLVNPTEGTFPGTEGQRVLLDMARVLDVDASRGVVRLACLNLNTSPSNVQWLSPMFDPRTGNGMYFVPKPGMFGIYLSIGGEEFFGPMFGVAEMFGTGLFHNNRESLPEGGVGIRTSNETKMVWSPNLLLAQAANFCKIILKRVSKSIDLLFYSFTMTSLSGSLQWITDLRNRVSSFTFTFRDRLPRARDVRGRPPKSDPAREFSLKVGASEQDDTDLIKATVSKVTATGQGNSLESAAVQTLRKVIRDYLQRRGIRGASGVFANDTLTVAFGSFILASDTTLDLVAESLVAAAVFTRQASSDGLNGLVDLTPAVDSVENLVTGEVTELGARSAFSLASETERFIAANTLENTSALGRSLVAKARRARDPKATIDPADLLFEAVLDNDGRISLETMDETGDLDEEEVGDPDPKGRLKISIPSLLRILSSRGPVDVDAGRGLRFSFSEGGLMAGNGVAGILFTPEGDVVLRGRRVTLQSMEERATYASDDFQAEEDEYADFLEDERCNVLGVFEDETERQIQSEFGYNEDTGRYAGEPNPPNVDIPSAESSYDRCGNILTGPWATYQRNVKAFFRRIEWRRREIFLTKLEEYEPTRQERLADLLINKNATEAAERRAQLTPEERDALELTDNGTSLQMSALGVILTSNSQIQIRSGIEAFGFESSRPNFEDRRTQGEVRRSNLEASGVPDFQAIDDHEATE